MTAREWLAINGKTPFYLPYMGVDQFYWGGAKDTETPDVDLDMLLPDAVFRLMTGQRTYPCCRLYSTLEEALADFEQAFNRLEAPL